jgi:hypothetical protein
LAALEQAPVFFFRSPYLREHPLNPRQIERVLGLPVAEQARLEEEALGLLRQGARDYGAV